MARPIGVTMVGILAIITGVLGLPGGALLLIALLAETIPGVPTALIVVFQVLTAVLIVSSVLYLVGGPGLLLLTIWGWWSVIVASILSIGSNISLVVINPEALLDSVPGLIIPLIFVVYLFIVREEHFGAGT